MIKIVEYLYAAHRKVRIAAYEHETLCTHLLEEHRPQQPPIPVQAAFAGVITAEVSATDKIADAISFGESAILQRPIANKKRGVGLLDWTLSNVPDDVPCLACLKAWNDNPVVSFAHSLRNKSIHRAYDKGRHDGEYVLDLGHHPYGERTGMHQIAIQDLTQDVVTHSFELIPSIVDLLVRYEVEAVEWNERLQREALA